MRVDRGTITLSLSSRCLGVMEGRMEGEMGGMERDRAVVGKGREDRVRG